jgi:hypothetical protein
LNIEERKKALQQQFFFRITMFLGSTILILICQFIANEKLMQIIMGIACSLFAWSIVSLWDFAVRIQASFQIDRRLFYKETLTYMKTINDKIIKEIGVLPPSEFEQSFIKETDVNKALWKFIYNEIEKLNEFIVQLPARQEVYVLTKEYIDYKNFIKRCYYFLLFNIESGSVDCQKFYNKFMVKNMKEVSYSIDIISKILNGVNETEQELDQLKNLGLNSEAINISDNIKVYSQISKVSKKTTQIDVNSGKETSTGVFFLPCVKFEENIDLQYKFWNLIALILDKKHVLYIIICLIIIFAFFVIA